MLQKRRKLERGNRAIASCARVVTERATSRWDLYIRLCRAVNVTPVGRGTLAEASGCTSAAEPREKALCFQFLLVLSFAPSSGGLLYCSVFRLLGRACEPVRSDSDMLPVLLNCSLKRRFEPSTWNTSSFGLLPATSSLTAKKDTGSLLKSATSGLMP